MKKLHGEEEKTQGRIKETGNGFLFIGSVAENGASETEIRNGCEMCMPIALVGGGATVWRPTSHCSFFAHSAHFKMYQPPYKITISYVDISTERHAPHIENCEQQFSGEYTLYSKCRRHPLYCAKGP